MLAANPGRLAIFVVIAIVLIDAAVVRAVSDDCDCLTTTVKKKKESKACVPQGSNWAPASASNPPISEDRTSQFAKVFPSSGYVTGEILELAADPTVLCSANDCTIKVSFVGVDASKDHELLYYKFTESSDGSSRTVVANSETVMFPNLSAPKKGCMTAGDAVTIGPFTANTRIGFALKYDGFNDDGDEKKAKKYPTLYSHTPFGNTALVTDCDDDKKDDKKDDSKRKEKGCQPTNRSHFAMAKDKLTADILLGIEDNTDDLSDARYASAYIQLSITNGGVAAGVPTVDNEGVTVEDGGAVDSGCKSYTITTNSTVSLAGFKYSTIDGINPASTVSGCQQDAVTMPTGWARAADTPDARSAVMLHQWGTYCVLFANNKGISPVTGEECADGSANLVTTYGENCYMPTGCTSRLLISQADSSYTSTVSNSGFTTTSGDSGAPLANWFSFSPANPYTLTSSTHSGVSGRQGACVSTTSSSSVAGGGLFQKIEGTNLPSKTFIVTAWAKKAAGTVYNGAWISSDYALYVDITYKDGTQKFGVNAPFGRTASTDDVWQMTRLVVDTGASEVDFVNLYLVFREAIGSVCWSDVVVLGDDGNLVLNPSFAQVQSTAPPDLTAAKERANEWAWLTASKTYTPIQGSSTSYPATNKQEYEDDRSVEVERTSDSDPNMGVVQLVTLTDDDNGNAYNGVTFSAASRVAASLTGNGEPNNYACWVDWVFQDGTKSETYTLTFDTSSTSFQYKTRTLIVDSTEQGRKIKTASVACVLRTGHVGKVYFDAMSLVLVQLSSSAYSLAAASTSSSQESYGDPHMITMDSLAYDFDGRGEFVLSADELITVQIRTAKAGNIRAINTAVAVGMSGDSLLTIQTATGNTEPIVRANCVVVTPSSSKPLTILGTGGGQNNLSFLSKTGSLETGSNPLTYTLVMPSSLHIITVSVFKSSFDVQFLRVRVSYPTASRGKLKGMLGNWDDDKLNDFAKSDGTSVTLTTDKPTYTQIYDFALTWRVVGKDDEADPALPVDVRESVFCYDAGKLVGSYDGPTPTEEELASVSAASNTEQAATARAACQATMPGVSTSSPLLEACVSDVLATDDQAFNTAYVQLASATGQSVSIDSLIVNDDSLGVAGGTAVNVILIVVIVVAAACFIALGVVVGRQVYKKRSQDKLANDLQEFSTDERGEKAEREAQGVVRDDERVKPMTDDPLAAPTTKEDTEWTARAAAIWDTTVDVTPRGKAESGSGDDRSIELEEMSEASDPKSDTPLSPESVKEASDAPAPAAARKLDAVPQPAEAAGKGPAEKTWRR